MGVGVNNQRAIDLLGHLRTQFIAASRVVAGDIAEAGGMVFVVTKVTPADGAVLVEEEDGNGIYFGPDVKIKIVARSCLAKQSED
jgi:hypothetical protein